MGREIHPRFLCPSAPASEGNLVLGVVGADGTLDYLRSAVPADRRFLDVVEVHGPAESRVRFAAPCASDGCRQWAGGRCTVPERVSEVASLPHPTGTLPHCAIRSRCRWFAQDGPTACTLCPLVTRRSGTTTTTGGRSDRPGKEL